MSNTGPAISFGTEKKKTKIKKTYAPGPGSYNLPGTVGNIPRYLYNAGAVAAQRLKSEKSLKTS
jgi:hypothetical protein